MDVATRTFTKQKILWANEWLQLCAFHFDVLLNRSVNNYDVKWPNSRFSEDYEHTTMKFPLSLSLNLNAFPTIPHHFSAERVRIIIVSHTAVHTTPIKYIMSQWESRMIAKSLV